MCLYPKLILNRKYLPNKKNGGNPPQVKDERTKYVPIGCGKCMECKKQRANGWRIRLMEELRQSINGKFVTLSFSNESLIELEGELESPLNGYDLENQIAKLAVRRFLERYRKVTGKSVRHWLVTELGQKRTERIHIHGIIWTNKTLQEIREIWKYGNVNERDKDWTNNYCTERTVNYIVKYVNKTDLIHRYYNSIILTSPGLGSKYIERQDSKLNRYTGENTRELYTTRQGVKLALPIYYRNKIYTEEQKEQLWLNRLDKNERWVLGTKIDISNGEEHYWLAIQQARRLNSDLKYGNDEINWERKRYEQQRRNLKRLQRIKEMAEMDNNMYDNVEVKVVGIVTGKQIGRAHV